MTPSIAAFALNSYRNAIIGTSHLGSFQDNHFSAWLHFRLCSYLLKAMRIDLDWPEGNTSSFNGKMGMHLNYFI